jgi:hypothetical protein
LEPKQHKNDAAPEHWEKHLRKYFAVGQAEHSTFGPAFKFVEIRILVIGDGNAYRDS